MIIGAHSIIYSKNAEADRGFLSDVLKFPGTDAGGGWLIFALPPSELAVHPSDENDRHELYLMCDDVRGFTRSLREKKVECSPIHEERWGSLTEVSLPGGGKLGVYQPKHARPPGATRSRATSKSVRASHSKATKGRRVATVSRSAVHRRLDVQSASRPSGSASERCGDISGTRTLRGP